MRREIELLKIRAAGVERTIVHKSAAMSRALEIADRVAPSAASVLITGESGTGKELVARRIHVRSARATGPFVAVNCAAIPGDLLESELFGHLRGAFTGAVRDRPGRFRQAHGGTLFLDEIGELPLPSRPSCCASCRSARSTSSAATPHPGRRPRPRRHQPGPHALVAAGSLRRDLLYRLNVVELPLPPLRERRDDIPPLVAHFVAQLRRRPRPRRPRRRARRPRRPHLARQRARARERVRARRPPVHRRRPAPRRPPAAPARARGPDQPHARPATGSPRCPRTASRWSTSRSG
jgi:sigma54-dependent transcription regulator